MNTNELLQELESGGFEIRADGTEIRIRGPEQLDADLIETLRERKQEIIKQLTAAKSNTDGGDVASYPPMLDNLTETERQAYQGWYDVMVGDKFNMSPERADAEAMALLLKTSRILKIEQASKDYKRDGYIKIFSTKLNRPVYLAKDEPAKMRVPDKSLQVFLESEIQAFNGLSSDELTLMLEAKAIFNFNGEIKDGDFNEDEE